ncbi:MAG: alpha/beta fold hydrolase [Cyanobacteria bacterium J06639_14]
MEALAIVGIAAEWGAAQSYTAQTTGLATSTTTASLSAIADAATRSQPWVAQDPLLETSLPVSREDFYVTSDPGVQIFVRKVLPVDQETTGHPILLIHGGGSAGLSNFDLDVPGYSLAATLAQAGHAAYILDVRGFGRSTRPASFDQPVAEVPPAVPIEVAVRDIQAVVEWIRARNDSAPVALLGWATGGHWAGLYTTQHNDKVSRLIILNSLYGVDAPWQYRERFEDPETPGEYDRNAGDRIVTAEQLTANWDRTIPVEDLSQWREPAVELAYQRLAFDSDPTTSTRTPPTLRIPGAFRREAYYLSQGRKYWEAADIQVPILIIRGENDHWSRPADVDALVTELVNAPWVESVTIPDGTHFLFLDRPERGRDRFIQAVLAFLQD